MDNRSVVFGEMLNRMQIGSLVEVGVHQAVFVKELLTVWKAPQVVYLVDHYPEGDTYFPRDEETTSRTRDIEIARQNVAQFSNLCRFIFSTSEQTAKTFQPLSIGMVYIDAVHDYENVKADMSYWFPIVANGGVLAGHDYWYQPVANAVNEFAAANGLTVNKIDDRDGAESWYCFKR